MLKGLSKRAFRGSGGRFGIVASKYNEGYVDVLVKLASEELAAAGAALIEVHRVPGAFEIPVVAASLAEGRDPALSAILCFGVIFQGETAHARQIADAVSHGLVALQIKYRVPVINGVYLFDTEEQARVRCLDRKHNRGLEAARTALEMARVMAGLRPH